MLKNKNLCLLLLWGSSLSAQQALTPTGNTLINNQLQIDYVIGQIETITLSHNQKYVTQGLLQPDPVIDCSGITVVASDDSVALNFGLSELSFIPGFNDFAGLSPQFQLLGDVTVGNISIPSNASDPWTFSLGKSTFSGLISFQYSICNTQCPLVCDTGTVKINVLNGLPNVITPNGDTFNEVFDPVLYLLENGTLSAPPNQLSILNRAGEIIFNSKPYQAWDAKTKNGKPVPVGAYFFILELTDKSIIKGPITVILD